MSYALETSEPAVLHLQHLASLRLRRPSLIGASETPGCGDPWAHLGCCLWSGGLPGVCTRRSDGLGSWCSGVFFGPLSRLRAHSQQSVQRRTPRRGFSGVWEFSPRQQLRAQGSASAASLLQPLVLLLFFSKPWLRATQGGGGGLQGGLSCPPAPVPAARGLVGVSCFMSRPWPSGEVYSSW